MTVTQSDGYGPYGVVRFPSSKPTDDARNDLAVISTGMAGPKRRRGKLLWWPRLSWWFTNRVRTWRWGGPSPKRFMLGVSRLSDSLAALRTAADAEIESPDAARFLTSIQQAIADVRRVATPSP